MKIERVEITNFAGIQHFLLEDLGSRDEVVIVGRNGVGKSQILLAIATAWNSESIGDYSKYLGPYGSALSICVRYVLDDHDIHELNNRARASQHFPEFQGQFLVNELEFNLFTHSAGTFRDELGNDFTELIRGRSGGAFAPLNWLSFLPADRIVGRSMQHNLALQGLASKQIAEANSQVINQIFQDWYQPHQFDVTDNLMTRYVADVIQSQATGQTVEQGIYQEVSDAFFSATGKRLTTPQLSSDGNIEMRVELPNGKSHLVSHLSSGEMMALQLLHFARTNVEHGNVLLVDEPEQHLHPSLQTALAELVRTNSGAGQIWFVTHSPAMLTSVQSQNLLIASRNAAGEQMISPAGVRIPEFLMEEAGISPGLWLPGNFVLIVEGETDEKYLRQLLPAELSRAYFLVAGNKSAVKQVANKMAQSDELIPFIAIIDRDLDDETTRRKWMEEPSHFMWESRAIESLFIRADLLHAVAAAVQPSISLETIKFEVEALAEDQKSRVRKDWLEMRVISELPAISGTHDSVELNFDAQAELIRSRAEYLREKERALSEEFEELWRQDKFRLVKPKEVFQRLKKSNPFSSKETLRDNLITQLLRDESKWPDDLLLLRDRLRGVNGYGL